MISNGFNPSYTGQREDLLKLIPHTCGKLLDVGCSTGVLGEQIKKRTTAMVVGIEIDEQMAKIAETRLDRVILGDVDTLTLDDHFEHSYFDCIIFADVLEHLRDPWAVLKESANFLTEGGVVIASIPNVRHYTTLVSLVFKGYWPYRERGIHDRTHLRFFTLRNIRDLFARAGLRITRIKCNYRLIEKPHTINRYAKCFALPVFRHFLVFQYLVVAKKD